MFRKARFKPTCIRRGDATATVEPQDNVDNVEDAIVGCVLDQVEEVKSIQKFRMKQRGINTTTQESTAVIESYDEEVDDSGILQKSFELQGEKPDEAAHDERLEAWIKARMSGGAASKKDGENIDNSEVSEEYSLYAISDELKVADHSAADADKMNWVTGLVEVELPLETKLQNIEATENAKRRLLKLGGELINEELRSEDADASLRKKAFGPRFQQWQQRPVPMSTDDSTVQRFRKRFRP